jgi:hypothetical protein
MRLGTAKWTPVFVLAALLPAVGQTQPERKLSAREIFYSAPKVAAKHSEAPRPAVQPTAAPVVQEPVTPVEPEPQVAVTMPPPQAEPTPVPAQRPEPPRPAPTATQFVPAALVELAPLGLRCSVLKREGPSDVIEVDPDRVFHSGDRIRLRVEANDDGYLYVVHQGSSGVWKPLFPSSEIKSGNNWIAAGMPHDIPQSYVFTFDDQPGEEKLFVVFSRQPVADLEELIYDLDSGAPPAPSTAPSTPAAQPDRGEKILLAQNLVDINDGLVNQLRNAYARDLIIEKVDDTAAADKYGKETAVYAVTASEEADSRVVVDLSLKHR